MTKSTFYTVFFYILILGSFSIYHVYTQLLFLLPIKIEKDRYFKLETNILTGLAVKEVQAFKDKTECVIGFYRK